MKKPSWIITDQNITVTINGKPRMLPRKDAYAAKVLAAIKAQRWDELPGLFDLAERIESASDGKFQVRDGVILVDGKPAPMVLGRKIKEFASEGLPYEPLVRFARNLANNPSFRAVNELYQFLEKNNHPITDNGNFIAYKKVREDFKDIHSGTMDNSVGTVVEMPRNEVDEDANRTCSRGLHVANWDYAMNNFGNRDQPMLEVEVNPADVVAIPTDYNQSKMRVCKYKVLSVIEEELKTPLRRTSNVDSGECCDHDCHDPLIGEDPNCTDDDCCDSVEELECEWCYSTEDVEYDVEECVDLCYNCSQDAEAEREEEEESDEEESDEYSEEDEDDDYPYEDELDEE